ncbi:chaperone DnaJ-domain superfamily protein [Wolffia australiana]
MEALQSHQSSPLLLLQRRIYSSNASKFHHDRLRCSKFPSVVFCSAEGSKVAYRLARDFEFANASENAAVLSVHPPLPPPAASPERTVSVPIDFYKVLGADTHFLSDGIRRAFEARCSTPPLEGFSQDALLARRQILQAACDTLSDPESRGEYNQVLLDDHDAGLLTPVPWDKVPGALCLLQESGDAEVVIQVGKRLLRERLSKPFKHDVVLAMALAYVDRSRDAMASSTPNLISGCDALERALKLLKEEGATNLAPSLQEQIDETLEEITPRYVLELLDLPLDEKHKRRRDEGLLGVRNILWAFGGGGANAIGSGFSRESFIKEVFSRLTSAEQVDLYLDRPANVAVEGFEVYSVALAFVAQAFVCKRPELIKNADALFLELQEAKVVDLGMASDYATKPELETDFALGRGLCCLLVGNVESCRQWLGLDDESFLFRSQSVIDFIKEYSNEEEEESGLLLGLCTLLEHWLVQVVLPRFRDTEDLRSRIGDYYDDPGVLEHLQRLEGGAASPLAAAAAIVRVGARATAALWKALPVAGRDQRTSDLHGSDEVADFLDDGVDESEWLMAKDSSKAIVFVKVLSACVAVGFLGFLGVRLSTRSLPPTKTNSLDQVLGVNSTAIDIPVPEESPKEAERMGTKLAEELVQRWQSIKSQALGPNHSIDKLPEVLDGEMLQVWRERASEIAAKGWFWEYNLLGLSVDSVTISLDGRRATVDATLDEVSRMTDPTQPDLCDSGRATYSVRYVLSFSAASGWRITGGAVLKP